MVIRISTLDKVFYYKCWFYFRVTKCDLTNHYYRTRFTLWNTYTGNRNCTFDGRVRILRLSRPDNAHRCTYMTLLFDTMPSWHSMPCDDALEVTLICEAQVKATQRTPTHLASEYPFIKCDSGEIVVNNKCFSLRLSKIYGSKFLSSFQLRASVENYFIHLFSLLTRQS